MAGVRIDLEGDAAALTPLLEPYTAAFSPSGSESIALRLSVDVDPSLDAGITQIPTPVETRPSAEASIYGFRQAGVRFELDAVAGVGRARIDGGARALLPVVELALQAVLATRGDLLVHAACGVDEAGAGWLLPGPSGAGKSTAAREAGFARVLADEKVAIRRRGETFEVWGTPFWSLGRRLPFDGGRVPLRRVCQLRKALVPGLRPWAPADALAGLLRCVVLAWDRPAFRARALDTVAAVVADPEVSTVVIDFPREGPWLTRLTPS